MLGLFSRDRNLVRLEVRRALNRPARATFCWGSKQAWTSGGVRASSGRDTIHARCTRLLSLPRVPAAPEALCAPPDGAAPAWSVHVTDTVSQRVGVTALTTPNPSETARRSPEGMDTQTHAHLPHTHTHRYTQTHVHTSHTHTDTHRDTHRHMHTHRDTHRHMHTHTDTHRHLHTEIHADTRAHTTYTQIHTDTCTHTHTDTHRHTHTHRDTYRHMHTSHTHRDTHRHTCTHHIHTDTHRHMHTERERCKRGSVCVQPFLTYLPFLLQL